MDPICRVTTPCIRMVCDINQVFPFVVMQKEKAHDMINAKWNRSAWNPKYKKFKNFFESSYQPYAQMALYFENEDKFYPRFGSLVSYELIEEYIIKWFSIYYSPNPYSKTTDESIKPTVISKFINNYLIKSGGSANFSDCLEAMFGSDVGNPDILESVINYFSDFQVDAGVISFKDGKNSTRIFDEEELYVACDPNDRSFFFEYFDTIKPHVGSEDHDTVEIDFSNISDVITTYLTAIRTKPFILLAGISGTGKSRIVRKLAQATDDIDMFVSEGDRWRMHSPSNFCLIQVKPNWHNSMDVVGFKSNIGKDGEHYEYTPFIEFISKAWMNEKTPFFLCLDEMNLAPVEEYFAEFLSAIESRSFGDNDQYETDPIVKPFKDFGDKVAFDMIEHLIGEHYEDALSMSELANRLYSKGLTLPKNLIVMGTVNMDETTFSFSRKVLDRAMSIEMNEVSYDDFLSGKTEEDIPLLTSSNILLVERPINAQVVKNNIDATSVIEYLKSINSILEGTPFKLGYRAANEAILYVSAAKMFGCNNLYSALDDFTLMKILSRIEGDDSKLKTKDGDDLLESLQSLFDEQFGQESETKSQLKIKQMIDVLSRDHFVSYWG